MARVYDGGSAEFRAAVYGQPHQATIDFLQRRFDDPTRALNLADQSFRQRAQTLFDQNYGEEALAARAAVRNALRRVWDADRIRTLTTLEDIQSARPEMQRWIMANPNLRRLHKRGAIAAYGDSYIDNSPLYFDTTHYDYRIVMNGMAVDDEVEGWRATTFFDELMEGDEPLDFADQINILQTWAHTDHLILSQDRDPTSPSNDTWG